ncbi:FAD-binding oxidoreductase [Nocardioides carbamazepini]|nr:FAD-binding oxidoreductase [Nocardioides carbamazepini]
MSVREIDRLKLAHDASHYLLTPQAVLTPADHLQVAALLRTAVRLDLPVTFRSGGTSLSGQAGTDQLLVDTRRRFRTIEVLDDGARVRVGPGATVAAVNARLAPYGRRLGPDPASETACTVGGVIANNSSGMTCGTTTNTYRTLASAVLVLASGTVLDTARPDADSHFAHHEPQMHRRIAELRDRVRADPTSVAAIRRQFSLKNTMGYGINAFLDFDEPVEILLHLVIGSEGTLAFVAAGTFRTVPLNTHRATGLLVFRDLRDATDALPALVAAELTAIELMDATSLRVAQRDPQASDLLRGLAVDRHAALLVEYQEAAPAGLADRVGASAALLAGLDLCAPATLTSDARERAALWHIRKGLYATVAGNRPSGTTALLEDVAVPVASLAAACEDLVELFARHGYDDSVIFGHAKDGNIHFLLNETFPAQGAGTTQRYLAFTDDMVDLVLGYDGTLKAEHGTGRIMAPYVGRQYGPELYDVMVELKRTCDPHGILNPDTILTDRVDLHVRDLKTTPTVEEEVDRCVECGYCEPVCPSRDLTTTPRQRIALRREIARAEQAGDTGLAQRLRADYEYDGTETCAADGMCQVACPVLIDTGQLTKRLRAENESRLEGRIWNAAAGRWSGAVRVASAGLTAAHRAPRLASRASSAARQVASAESVPQWQDDLPRGGAPRRPSAASAPAAVYLPACISSMFGPEPGGSGVAEAVRSLSRRAGIELRIPDDVAGLCCGTPWKSKGHLAGYDAMAARVRDSLWRASEQGRLPVVIDASSCTEGLAEMLRTAPTDELEVVDAVRFVATRLLDRLEVRHRLPSLTLHPTCSSTRLGLQDDLLQLAEAIADDVHLPADWGCCAFAGDRGLLHPELTAAATAAEAAQVRERPTTAYASLNRTCEIGMTRATGRPYRHVLELLLDAVEPARA